MPTVIFKSLLTIAGAVLLYFLIRSRLPEDISTELATNFGILGFIGAGIAYLQGVRLELMQHRRAKHANKRVKITLRYEGNGESTDHPVAHEPRRGDISRAELQGILGTIPLQPGTPEHEKDRYALEYMSDPDLLRVLDEVTEDKSVVSQIVIPYSKTQFVWDFEEAEHAVQSGA